MWSLRGRLTRKRGLVIGAGVIAIVGLALLYRQIDIAAVHRRADAFDGVVVFVAMVVLPLLAFPISVVHAVAGLRFGIGWGCVLVALATFLQLLSAYGLVKLAPGFFARRLEPMRQRLPAGTHRSLTLFTMLLPGVPYFAQIYVLPLVGVPLRIFLCWSLPINVARSVVGVTFGGLSGNLTPLRLAGFGTYFVAITLTCSWSFRRLRRKMREQDMASGTPASLSETRVTKLEQLK